MNAAMIVMENPLVEDLLQVPFSERNHEVQAVATDRTDQSLASGICLGRLRRCMWEQPVMRDRKRLIYILRFSGLAPKSTGGKGRPLIPIPY